MRPLVRIALPFVAALGVSVATGFFPSRSAEAKTSFDSPYTLAQTYNAALRLVRVDLGLKVNEKDAAAAYVMFDYKSVESGSRVVPGSIEMLDSARGVKVIVQLSQMPRYHEQVLSDALTKKLREEYGEPARTKGPPLPDAGADAGSGEPLP